MPSEPPTTGPTPATDATASRITVAQPPTMAATAAAASAAPSLPPGTPEFVGEYAVLGVLGRGGMGIVYKAHDKKLNRVVALKLLWAGPEASTDDLIRFRGEAELIANLKHPNVVEIYDIGQHDGNPFLVLEYVEGGGLDKRIQGQPQPPRYAAEVVETLARAMYAVHTQHVMHRDLKPANVLVTASGRYKITDFGLAKRLGDSLGYTRTGDLMGTPSYMAPEQALGKKVGEFSPAIDVYALGAILYEMLTGRPPFKGASVPDTLELVRNEEPASPSRLVPKLHRDLSTICLKCLHKSPTRRYASAEELADDLRRWLDGDPIRARPVGGVERLWLAVKRRPLLAASLVSLGVCATALALYGVAARNERHQSELRATEQAHRLALEGQFENSLTALDDVCVKVMDERTLNSPAGLKALHKTLQDYYDKLIRDQEGMQWSKRERLADACLRLGELMRKTGDKLQAAEAYRKAGDLYAELIRTRGPAEDSRDKLGQTKLERGKLSRELGDFTAAADHLKAARDDFAELAAEAGPRSAAFRAELAEAWHQTGSLLQSTRADKHEALAAFAKGLELREQLVAEAMTRVKGNAPPPEAVRDLTEYRRDLARSHGYIGDIEMVLGDRSKADASYWESHRLRKAVAETTKELEDKFQFARSFQNFGNFQLRVRAFATARDWFDQAAVVQSELVKQAPTYTEYQSDRAATHCRVGELLLLQHRPADEAAAELDAARHIYEGLLVIDPKSTLTKAGLVEARVLLAVARVDAKPDVARDLLNEARPLAEALAASRRDPQDYFYLAAIESLDLERLPPAERAARAPKALESLRSAIQQGYRRRHPTDVKQDRAFRAAASTDGFAEVLREYETVSRAAAAR